MSNPVMTRKRGESFSQNDPQWVRKYFVEPAPEGGKILKTKVRRGDGREAYVSRIYLPARLRDNPDKQFVEDYELTLLGKPPHIRQALLEGSWWVTEGAFYANAWREALHVRESFAIPDDWPRFRSMDWGFKNPGTVLWWAMDPDGNLICERELTFKGKSDVEVALRIREIEEGLGLWKGDKSTLTGPADTQLWEQRGNSAASMAAVMAKHGVRWVAADKRSRMNNAQRVLARLADHRGGTADPGLMFFKECKQCITTLPGIQAEPGDPEMPADGGDDHWHDAICYAVAFASHGAAGIPTRSGSDDDDDDDDYEGGGSDRGRDGYGSRV